MIETAALAIIFCTFLLAGAVKGVVGLGLPTVTLAVLTAAIGLKPAMALLLVPSFVTNFWQAAVGGNAAMALMIVPSLLTNVWQASVGGNARTLIARLWPFLLLAAGTIWIGALGLTRVDLALLSALLGLLLISYALAGLTGFRIVVA